MEFTLTPELEEKIKNAESLDEVVKVCAEEGVEVTKEELEAVLSQLENTELDENALDDVSGGLAITTTTIVAGAVGLAVGWAIYNYNRRKYRRR